ncbi:hypothetical protein ACH4E7_43475 [Kitasatospora sp. NPDC018058]|uniref:hypothetical protein n=1 Tax=Kitasatospora sp. NPDC018058 TaxID=3364025 RepID=UPI0037C1A4EC
MSYDYWCGVCRTISTHPSRAAAETGRADHIAAVHHGRRPDRERITPPPAPAPAPAPRPSVLIALLTKSKAATAFVLVFVVIFLYGLLKWSDRVAHTYLPAHAPTVQPSTAPPSP